MKKIRNTVFMIALISFTLMFAAAGLWVPDYFMNQQQKNLTQGIKTVMLPTAKKRSEVSTKKLMNAAAVYGLYRHSNDFIPCEPTKNQIGIGEIISIAHDQLNQLCQLNILPDLFSEGKFISETIQFGTFVDSEDVEFYHEKSFSGDTEYLKQFQNSERTCWYIQIVSEKTAEKKYFYSNFFLHPVTGQILRIEAFWNHSDSQSKNLTKQQLFKQYMRYLDIPSDACMTLKDWCYVFDYHTRFFIKTNQDSKINQDNQRTQSTKTDSGFQISDQEGFLFIYAENY
ncbi:MAG: hypothetical protein Q4F21_03375 [Lachnospiraceae bacterium]|nr:hypothetical protein [Lachnospiraceae bacterium]